uniref:RecX first three-helical domain-containing protein n=1 Tax=Gossypium raimondii TaxID=29730 RepID=A0A0D2V2H2_GOSRA|nr:hypothetical protein B456_009G452100 [Gossypium raimondii]
MSIFAGNLSFKISSTLQFRVFSFPWMNGNKAIFCLKEKEYSSSVPVRYIPKKSLETEEPETSSHSKGLSKNESRKSAASNVFGRKFTNNEGSVIDKKSQTRSGMFKKIALYDDVQQGDEIMEKPVEAVEEVPQGQNINRKNPLQACKRMSDAEKSAIELLAARAFTAVELRKKLLGKRFDPDIVETLITDLQNRCVDYKERYRIDFFEGVVIGSICNLFSYVNFSSIILLSILSHVKQLIRLFWLIVEG